jgi:UDP-GlcNAc:undecaprenyl-phosphate GlcNAc-1-phosphate transferase
MLDVLYHFLGFLIGGIFLSVICNQLLLRFSRSLGIRNNNDVVIRWSNESKPSIGGLSFFVVFIFSSVTFSILTHDDNIFNNSKYHLEFTGLFIAASLAFLMGLADDAYNTKPLFKLLIQIACGLVIIYSGTWIHLTHVYVIDVILTILWVIIVMNSLNMLDNLDGITGITTLFILITCLISNWIFLGFSADIWSLILIGLIGSLIGFLRFNIHPSKLFMGDAGSQFIGFVAAFFAIKFLWNASSFNETHSWASVILVLTAFTPAAVDTLSVVINRISKGKSPMVGGKDHTTHHLVYSGLNDRQVWYVFFLIGLLSCLLSIVLILFIKNSLIFESVFFLSYFIIVFAILYRYTIKYKAKS